MESFINKRFHVAQSVWECYFKIVGMTRFELATAWSQTKNSTGLSYIPIIRLNQNFNQNIQSSIYVSPINQSTILSGPLFFI